MDRRSHYLFGRLSDRSRRDRDSTKGSAVVAWPRSPMADDTSNVTARLRLKTGETSDVMVSGVLDHTDFPPTFDGHLIQPK